MKNAHEFPGLYDDLFDFPKAGYVMIDVDKPWGYEPSGFVRDMQYVSPDPDLYWMKGLMTSWHVTARGPLDPKVKQSHCKQVLEDVKLPNNLVLGDLEAFPSPYPETPYDCIVIRIEDERLYEINQQLAVLPGVQTYIPYKPHLTLGYFKAGHTQELLRAFDAVTLHNVDVIGYDFGRMQP